MDLVYHFREPIVSLVMVWGHLAVGGGVGTLFLLGASGHLQEETRLADSELYSMDIIPAVGSSQERLLVGTAG